MKYIILCGGIGKRNNNYSLPKPLNYVNGRHLIEYIIESILSDEIYIIYNIGLSQYNFVEIIINKFKNKTFYFSQIDFLTRGAVETAYIGIQQFNMNDDNILFIDNDNYHDLPHFQKFDKNFIGYGLDYDKTNFSFITIKDNYVINIEEKNKISDNYCCGLYGFLNKEIFLKLAKELIYENNKTKNEFYFSQLYKLLISKGDKIIPVQINSTTHLGTFNEMLENKTKLKIKKLRICFDLDNTLVTYPTLPGDYSSVKPIEKNIKLLKCLKKQGHEIIIYTARRMLTHNSNVGKVIKDIAMVTLQTLEDLNIPYDEIIFGKPIADIYIDDRALNPYYNSSSLFGLFIEQEDFITNKIENNKYNRITKKDDYIVKLGPYGIIKGELYMYQNIPEQIKSYFPKLKDFNKMEEQMELKLEHIDGIPLYYLYKSKTLTTKIIDELFDILQKMHSMKTNLPINITKENIKSNYIEKLKNRFNLNDYYFDDATEVFQKLIEDLETLFDPNLVSFIHGDFWFSNIILTYDDNYKFIDMKGQVDNILTTNGDAYYDYGKLYQSILGFDLILHKDSIDQPYIQANKDYFLSKCEEHNLNIPYLKMVTKSLVFGVFHSLPQFSPNENIWDFIKTIA
jgi:capsule biosynthesis phosphatase